jgi:prophage regulatory protein
MQQQTTDESILRLDEVMRMTALSKPRIYALEKEGKFPVRRRLSARAVGWIRSEVQAFITNLPPASVVGGDAGVESKRLSAAARSGHVVRGARKIASTRRA